MMIALLGTGYVAAAFASELTSRSLGFKQLSRSTTDYADFKTLRTFLDANRVTFLINAAGFSPLPNVDACEKRKADAILANVVLPSTVACACAALGIPWGHVSSGCIYDSAHCHQPPEGFSEDDTPNFSFRNPPCSFYSGSKSLGEEAIAGIGRSYIWRIRMPFSEADNAKNLISKLLAYRVIYDSPENSMSHLGDCVGACVDLWEKKAAPGIYNVTNPGTATNRWIVGRIREILQPARAYDMWVTENKLYESIALAPRSNCVLSGEKLKAAGIILRPVREALEDSLSNFKLQSMPHSE
jgi:dTDP-4-dehydrorhamnose reductase